MTLIFDISQIQDYHYGVAIYLNGYIWSTQGGRPVAGHRFGGGLSGIPGSGASVFKQNYKGVSQIPTCPMKVEVFAR